MGASRPGPYPCEHVSFTPAHLAHLAMFMTEASGTCRVAGLSAAPDPAAGTEQAGTVDLLVAPEVDDQPGLSGQGRQVDVAAMVQPQPPQAGQVTQGRQVG